MKKNFLAMLVVAFVLTTGILPVLAATHDDVDTWGKFWTAIKDASAPVVINVTEDIEVESLLGIPGTNNFTIQSGTGSKYTIDGKNFGGLGRSGNINPTIDNIIFENFIGPGAANNGGVLNAYDSGSIGGSISNSEFLNNRARDGGAIDANDGNITTSILNSIFSGNIANNSGGALSAMNITSIIKNTLFGHETISANGNTAANNGGAIYARTGSFGTAGVDNILGSTFANNKATAGAGGAIWVSGSFLGNITSDASNSDKRSKFFGNTAGTSGGAIHANNFSGNIINTDFQENTAGTSGGAIYTQSNFTGSITNALFDGNTATSGSGGAIYVNGGTGTLTIADTNFTGNTAGTNGGAIYSNANLIIRAIGEEVEFSGNTATGRGSDIYLNNKALTLQAKAGKKISFDGGIDLNGESLVIGDSVLVNGYTGTVLIDANLNEASSVTIYDGATLQLGDDFTLTRTGTTAVTLGGTLSTVTAATEIDLAKVSTLTVSGANAVIDAILKNANIGVASGNTLTLGDNFAMGSGSVLNLNGTLLGDSSANINIAAGTLKLGDSYSISSGSNLNIDGGILESLATNTAVKTLNINDLTVGSNGGEWKLNIDFDPTNIAGSSSDKINVAGDVTGTLTITSITDIGSGGSIPSPLSIGDTFTIAGVINKDNVLALDLASPLWADLYRLDGLTNNAKDLLFVVGKWDDVISRGGTVTLSMMHTIDDEFDGALTKALTINGSTTIPTGFIAKNTGVSNGFNVDTSGILTLNDITMENFNTAVTQTGGTLNPINTSFIGNGTGIDTNQDLNLWADGAGAQSIFSGNGTGIKTNRNLMIVADNGGTVWFKDDNTLAIDFSGADGKSLAFSAQHANSKIIIDSDIKMGDNTNYVAFAGDANGVIELNAQLDGSGDVGAYIGNGVTLKLGDNGYFGDNMKAFYVYPSGGTIDLTGASTFGNLPFGDMILAGNLNLAVKADLAYNGGVGRMDTIEADSVAGTGKIIVNQILLTSEAAGDSTSIEFAKGNIIGSDVVRYTGGDVAYSPIYTYRVSYDDSDGKFTFDRGTGGGGGGGVVPPPSFGDFNPAIMSSSVAANGGAQAIQANNFAHGFRFADRFMNLSKNARFAYINQNRYAISEPIKGAVSQDEGSIWFNPHVSIEKVKLDAGGSTAKINNTVYGSYFGGDMPLQELKHGWSVVHSVLGGYTGAHQSYDGVSIYQNGAMLGATSTFFKNDFFVATAVNAGYMNNEASTMFGHDNFHTLASGAAVKFGNNFEWKKLILQPSLMTGYTFIKTFDYTTASGVDMSSDALHALTFHPELKLIGNFESGWQPYIAAGAVWNHTMGGQVRADNIYLPQLSEKAYAQYGFGVQKAWGDRFTGFAQAMFRSGGRDGVAFSFGLNIALGKDPKKLPKKEAL